MKRHIRGGFILLALVFSGGASAHPPDFGKISLGTPRLSGTGCYENSTGVALSEDGQVLSILFDDYLVRAGKQTLRDEKYCDVIVPIQFPPGTYVSLIKVDYRGFNSLPDGGHSTFKTQYEFEGLQTGRPGRSFSVKGPVNSEFIDTNQEQIRSRCGTGDGDLLRINTRLMVQSNAKGDDAFSQVDSADLTQPQTGGPPGRGRKKDRRFFYHLRVKKCPQGRGRF